MADIYAEVTAVGIQGLSGTGSGTGYDGATGSTGPAGASGVSGATGAQGASGSAGLSGATGASGANGSQGASGVQGASGSAGLDGATGTNGADGASGVTGASGAAGDKYHTTSTSTFTIGGSGNVTVTTVDLNLDYSTAQTIILAYDGSNHQHGRVVSYNQATGELVFTKTDASGGGTYSSWQINLDGAVGITGASGVAGAQGASGVTGSQGIQGASGVDGASGITGASGVAGATGSQGEQGASGIDGATGIQGASGVIGASGATGSQGVHGASGHQGASGIQGASGVDGASGVAGLDGDRYHTTSTTTFTLGDSGSQTITLVDSNLDYSIGQDVVVAYDGSHRQYGNVTAFDSGTNALTFDKVRAVGTGTYSSWEVNLDGAVGIQGSTGLTGASGVDGATGTDGATGPAGVDGATGVDGASGLQGASGVAGLDGATGAEGATGLTGATGAGPETITFTTSSTAEVVVETINASIYRSVKYEMQVTSGSDYAVSELRLLIDTPNVFLTEYAGLGSPLGSFASFYSPLSNNYSSPDINNGGLSFWNNTDLTIYTSNANVIEALLSAPVSTVISLNSGALSATLASAFTEVNAGVYTATTTTSNSPNTLVTNISWTGSGNIELRFTPVNSITILKYKKVMIEV